MSNIQSSRAHIIETRIMVPAPGSVGDLRDLIYYFENNGPTSSRSADDAARFESDDDWLSLVWTESRKPLPQFEELETFVRWLADKQRASRALNQASDLPEIDIITLDNWAKRFRTAPDTEKI